MSEAKITIIKPDIWSIIKIVGICLGLWFLYIIRDIILIVLVAGVLATIITPIVNYFEHKKIPRWLGAFFVFIIIFLILGLIGWTVVPMAISQGKLFVEQVPVILKSFLANASIETQAQFSGLLNQWLNTSPINGKAFFSLLGNVAGQIISFLMILIIAFYLSVRKRKTQSPFG
ncbi:AI-2E family transporter, partial [bacterium]|nr:AI-2E family transporter [bacterium]